MGAETGIAWTDHTFNPWWGCVRVSPGCTHCYAETWDTRWRGGHWGVQAPRRFFGDAHWNEPRKWDRDAATAGVRRRVFCASMADVFEDRRDLDAQRERLWKLIAETPHLDWQLLTKRPENIARLMNMWDEGGEPWPNVWLGTTVEDQQRADERIPALLAVPAAVRFLSVEPLLGPVDLRLDEQPADWVIVGGESGAGARPLQIEWARGVVGQCYYASVACFVKQLGPHPVERAEANLGARQGYDPNNILADTGPRPPQMKGWTLIQTSSATWYQRHPEIKDSKGGDPAEWPADLRVREFPAPLRAAPTAPSREE